MTDDPTSETGPGKRPFDPQWAADFKEQCDAAGVCYYDKRETHAHWREWPGVTP
jgi:protein gp37